MRTDSFSVLAAILMFSVSASAGGAESIERQIRQMDAEVNELPPLSKKPPADSGAFNPPAHFPDKTWWPISTPDEKPWYTNLWETNPFSPRHRPAWIRTPLLSAPVSINDWNSIDNLSWYNRLIRRFQRKFPDKPGERDRPSHMREQDHKTPAEVSGRETVPEP